MQIDSNSEKYPLACENESFSLSSQTKLKSAFLFEKKQHVGKPTQLRLMVGFAFAFVTIMIMAQAVRADQTIADDDFNDYTNAVKSGDDSGSGQTNIFSNTNGIGGGFYVSTWGGGVITESNSFISLTSQSSGGDRSGIASVEGMPISSSGSVFEFTNVQFAMNPVMGSGGIDRGYVGVANTNNLNNSGGGWQTTPPPGFYVQFESDSISDGGSGNANFDGNSVFFYQSASGAKVNLASWTFDTLNFRYSADGGDTNLFNFTPVLDVKITIDGANWHVQITGDTQSGAPIDFSGTYSGNFDGNVPPGEIVNGYAVAFSQSSVNMSIDRAIMKELGDFIVGTPSIATPDYPYNTNYVYAGESVVLSDTASGVGTLAYQWQMQDPAGSGAYADIPDATNITLALDTTALGDSNQRNIQLVVSNGSGASTNSAPVALTVATATAPVVVSDTSISPNVLTNYVGGQVAFSAAFQGNHPIAYQWQSSMDDSTWNNLSGATNTALTLTNLQVSDGQFYRLTATNAFSAGTPSASTPLQLSVLAGGQHFVWSSPVWFLGLTAEQILMTPSGELAGAAMFGNGPITVSLGANLPNFVFLEDTNFANVTGAGNGFGGAFGTNTTGNGAFDSVLGGFNPDGNPKMITINNLVVGQQYSVQLFALDDRTGIGTSRMVDFQDPSNAADVSVPFETLNNENYYEAGTFYASNTTEVIQENLLQGGGNMNALVLRAIGWNPPPYTASVANQTTYTGSSVSFNAAIGSYTTNGLIYQWMAGPSGGPFTNLVAGTKYAGVDTANLTISNVTSDDGLLQYQVSVSNPAATINSSVTTETPATLTVNNLSVAPMLIGEWLNGSQRFADESGYTNPHDGYIIGANYTWSSDVPSGSGYSLSFGANGINLDTVMVITNTSSALDGAYTPTFDSDIGQNMTVACWAKGFPPGAWNPWVSKNGEPSGYQLRDHGSDPNSCWSIRGTSGANGGDLEASVTSNDGKWHYYVGTYDGNLQTIYVDGVQAGQQAATGAMLPDTAAPLVIGAKSTEGSTIAGSIVGGSYFTGGSIYDVRIYNYALTTSQITQLYASYPPPTQKPTLNLIQSGSSLTLNYQGGILLEATNLTGPWTTNNSPSPFTITPTGPQKFFRILQQ